MDLRFRKAEIQLNIRNKLHKNMNSLKIDPVMKGGSGSPLLDVFKCKLDSHLLEKPLIVYMVISNAMDQSNVSFPHQFTLTVTLNGTDDKFKILKNVQVKHLFLNPQLLSM